MSRAILASVSLEQAWNIELCRRRPTASSRFFWSEMPIVSAAHTEISPPAAASTTRRVPVQDPALRTKSTAPAPSCIWQPQAGLVPQRVCVLSRAASSRFGERPTLYTLPRAPCGLKLLLLSR